MKQAKTRVALTLAVVLTAGGSLGPHEAGAAFNRQVYEACAANCNLNTNCTLACCGKFLLYGCIVSKTLFDSCYDSCSTLTQACYEGCSALAGADIDPKAVVSDNGRHLTVTGPLLCEEGLEVKYLRATVTQRAAGGFAEGQVSSRSGALSCTGGDQQFTVEAVVRGHDAFRLNSPAQVCAVVEIGIGGLTTDTRQWCREVLLVPNGSLLLE